MLIQQCVDKSLSFFLFLYRCEQHTALALHGSSPRAAKDSSHRRLHFQMHRSRERGSITGGRNGQQS